MTRRADGNHPIWFRVLEFGPVRAEHDKMVGVALRGGWRVMSYNSNELGVPLSNDGGTGTLLLPVVVFDSLRPWSLWSLCCKSDRTESAY